jgi:hypothetical protein
VRTPAEATALQDALTRGLQVVQLVADVVSQGTTLLAAE